MEDSLRVLVQANDSFPQKFAKVQTSVRDFPIPFQTSSCPHVALNRFRLKILICMSVPDTQNNGFRQDIR